MGKRTLTFLMALILIGGALRIWASAKSEFDSDDPLSLLQASGNYSAFRETLPLRIVPAAYFRDIMLPQETLSPGQLYSERDPNHPILYFILLHYWLLLTGYTLFTACLPAIFFGTLSIPLFYLVSRRLLPGREALMATAFLAGSGMFIYLSSLIRHYTLFFFLGCTFTYFALRLDSNEKPRFIDYLFLTILGLAGIYTHFLFWLVLIPVNIFYLWRNRSGGKVLARWIFCQAVLLLAALPDILYRLHTKGQIRPPSQIDLMSALNAVYRNIIAYFYRYQISYASRLDQVLGIGLTLVVGILFLLFIRGGKGIRFRGLIILFLILNFAILPVAAYLMQVPAYIHQPKYLIFGGMALFIAVAGGLGRVRITKKLDVGITL